MAEKVKVLNIQRDKKFLYFIDGEGNVKRKPKCGDGETVVVIAHAVERDSAFLYFIDQQGDIARSPRGSARLVNGGKQLA